jgi:cell division protein FtsX
MRLVSHAADVWSFEAAFSFDETRKNVGTHEVVLRPAVRSWKTGVTYGRSIAIACVIAAMLLVWFATRYENFKRRRSAA